MTPQEIANSLIEDTDPDEIEALATSVIGPQPETDREGTVRWFWRGLLHREDGPAVEWANGNKWWCRNGLLHRDDGPAVEYADGYKAWYRNGVKVEPFTEDMDPDELEALATSVMGPQPVTDKKGTVRWYWKGRLHREDGPAIEWANGTKEWYRNGVSVEPFTESMDPDELEALATSVMGPQPETDAEGTVRWYWKGRLHREDGPAIERENGDKSWWRNGLQHREDGPAVEEVSGFKAWYRNGLRHRDDGPAVEWADGSKSWYRNGVLVYTFTESMDPDELEALATSVMGPQPETDAEGTVRWLWKGQLHRDDGPAVEYVNGTKEWWRNGQRHRDDGPAWEWADGSKEWWKDGIQVEPFTESMDPDELEALATSVMGPQPETDEEGNVHWYWKGRLHRDDGPAIECVDGFKAWCRNGRFHRDDGPAVEWPNEFKSWYRNGELHRDDGPAIERANGTKEWYRNGVSVEPFTESMDPDELEAIANAALGPQPETDAEGTVRWRWKGLLHREDGPAIERENGDKSWWRNGLQHREDGPAVEWADGSKWWCRNGELHREDGPAFEGANGDKEWYRNGRRHRDDGPAIEWADGYKAWYRNGVKVEPFTESMDSDELEALATSVMGPQPETDKEGSVHWYWRGRLHREDGPAIEWANGDKEWYRNGLQHRDDGPAVEEVSGSKGWWRNGKRHRDDGPAVEYANGDKEWWRNGEPHRDDGPAIEHVDGYKAWYRNGLLHREDGPAVEWPNEFKSWYRNGQLHRDDGPAIERADGTKVWYRNGVKVEPFTESIDFDSEEVPKIAHFDDSSVPPPDDEVVETIWGSVLMKWDWFLTDAKKDWFVWDVMLGHDRIGRIKRRNRWMPHCYYIEVPEELLNSYNNTYQNSDLYALVRQLADYWGREKGLTRVNESKFDSEEAEAVAGAKLKNYAVFYLGDGSLSCPTVSYQKLEGLSVKDIERHWKEHYPLSTVVRIEAISNRCVTSPALNVVNNLLVT